MWLQSAGCVHQYCGRGSSLHPMMFEKNCVQQKEDHYSRAQLSLGGGGECRRGPKGGEWTAGLGIRASE